MEGLTAKMFECWKEANRNDLTRSEVNALSDKVSDLKGYGHILKENDELAQFQIDSMADKIQWLLCKKLIEAFDREKK